MATKSDIKERIARNLESDYERPERETDLEAKLLSAAEEMVSGIAAIDEVIRRYNVGLHKSQPNIDGKLSVRFFRKPAKKMMQRRPWMAKWSHTHKRSKTGEMIPATDKPMMARELSPQRGFSELRVRSKIKGGKAFENDRVTARLLNEMEGLLELRREALLGVRESLAITSRVMRRVHQRLSIIERRYPDVMKHLVHDWMDPAGSMKAITQKIARRREQARYRR
ncbi:hypothetical protein [Burkholderia anthina]|uniref:hypothetical protein n=1 Tax=Burkholderia anthina TaxID=179879 RepID=UPI0037C19300